jgi:hypothetical protein
MAAEILFLLETLKKAPISPRLIVYFLRPGWRNAISDEMA